ncbi:MAG: HlyD family efflux transporter periplasmic adaptor subunit [Planctomycetes bacterium]|nr:HlyD family efflux transporter periplasmic adaptor subunit [Planctomycetota bacterium]NOG54603.1 HlyD family efflux transporter periplasmic adaptor subunit [Planctomycetota bacterium]
MSIWKTVLTLAVIFAILTGLGFWFGPKIYKKIQPMLPNQKTPETIVRVELPSRGDLVELIQAPGEVEPKTKVELSARVSSRITELPFEEGDTVPAGAVVVRLDSTDLAAALEAATARRAADAARIQVQQARIESSKAGLEGTKASLRQALTDLERQQSLLTTGDTSQSAVEGIQQRVDELTASIDASERGIKADELNLVVMKHSLEVADAEIAQARDRLGDTVIKSPLTGILTKLNAEVGEMVITGTMNNPGTVIIEIADLSKMLLVAQVDEADVGGLALGQQATVRINAYPDQEFDGIVESIALTHDLSREGSKYYKTEILLRTDGQRIYSGLTADVDIETLRHPDIIRVPSQAVLARKVDDIPLSVRDGNPDVDMTKTMGTVVFRLVDNKAIVTPVTIGPSDLTHTVILSGLSDDDQIIVGPYKVLENIAHDQACKDEKVAAAEAEAEKREAETKGAEKDEGAADEQAAPSNDDADDSTTSENADDEETTVASKANGAEG